MRKYFFLGIVLTGIFGIGCLLTISAEENLVPNWVKNTALWYGQGSISDTDFISAIQFLMDKKILTVPSSNVDSEHMEEYKKWAKEEISKYQQYSNNLKDEIKRLEIENTNLEAKLERTQSQLELNSRLEDQYKKSLESEFKKQLSDLDSILTEEERKPQTTINDQKINWRVADSKGNLYYWEMPIESYESLVASQPYLDTLLFEMPSGDIVEVVDHTKFVGTSFTNVIDDVHVNTTSDEEFIYEIWYIVSQLTTYSFDIGEYPRYALETLSRGGGDCEDTAILIADMLRSSKHTSDWVIQLVYFDSDNPELPKTVNHVAVVVDTGESYYIIESTAKDEETLDMWAGKDVFGWWYDV
ncbi:MAG: hypothetical protein K5793_02780 [Nitrosarchaeum sp.]|nr:hypothetical protein [Nitrosarchaeum sp.]